MNATARFRLGRIVSTPHALEVITHEDILAGISQHQAGDWGEVPPEDRVANDQALVDGTRILSAYRSAGGVTFWIITEADRSSTTVLLPEDYGPRMTQGDPSDRPFFLPETAKVGVFPGNLASRTLPGGSKGFLQQTNTERKII